MMIPPEFAAIVAAGWLVAVSALSWWLGASGGWALRRRGHHSHRHVHAH